MKNKMLIAGGGYADIPLIIAAKKLGFYVITSGNRKDDLGHKFSDEVKLEDFSNKNAMLKLAMDLKIDVICPSCNDFSAVSSSYVANKLNLPGHDSYETTLTIHHKDMFRRFARENKVNTPLAFGFDDKKDVFNKLDEFKFPLIIKPVDLTGGKGISIVYDFENLEKKIDNALNISKAKRIVVEEFIDGTNHGFSSILRDGKVVFYFCDNEYYYINKYLVSSTSTSTKIPEKVKKELILASEKIASLLNLKDGIFHVQYILRDNIPYIIEICRRAPGDLYLKFVEHATKIDYSSYIVKSVSGLSITDLEQKEPDGNYARHCIMTNRAGNIEDIKYDESIKYKIIEKFLWWQKGFEVKDILTEKLGIVFLKFSVENEMFEKIKNIHEYIKPIIKNI